MDVAALRERDLRKIDKYLNGQRLGIIADPWMRESLLADMGDRILVLQPGTPDDASLCAAVLIHSQWPDEGPWTGKLLPRFGGNMHELIDRCMEGGEFKPPRVRAPIFYWDLEGGNPNIKETFNHFAAAANVIGTTSKVGEAKWQYRFPGTPTIHIPMAASSFLFGEPHLPLAQSGGVIFTGRWYAGEKERCDFLYRVVSDLDKAGMLGQFMITAWGDKDTWPADFHRFLVPKLPFYELGKLYQRSALGINHNLWKGGVAMRYPCMMMAGLPTLQPHGSLEDILDRWNLCSKFNAIEGAMDWRLTQRVLAFFEAWEADRAR